MSISAYEQIHEICQRHFDKVAIAKAQRPQTMNHYIDWLSKGFNGSMKYLEYHTKRKQDPSQLLEGAKSFVVLLLHYDTQEPLSVDLKDKMKAQQLGWISRYARGRDYHQVIEEKHKAIIEILQDRFPDEKFLSCVDTKAVLERDFAAQSGLGWIGKNSCLINNELGSFVFISEILTTLELPVGKPVADHCGTCQKCLEACPTGALISERNLDATKCISYWTIESKTPAPKSLSKNFGFNFFGCDICQDVCPWNHKSRKHLMLREPVQTGLTDLSFFALSDDENIEDKVKQTAMERAKPAHLRENAKVALRNLRSEADHS